MTTPPRLLVLVAATALATGCSNFRRTDGGSSLQPVTNPLRWVPDDSLERPLPRRFPSVTAAPGGAILFGGLGASGPIGEAWRWDGARWQLLSGDGAPGGRIGHAAAWTDGAFCLWGGEARGSCLDDGACWNPSTGRWQPLGAEVPLSARSAMASASNGRDWILWGGRDADGNDFADGARYDPSTRRWSALPDGGPRARHGASTAVSPDGSRVLIWGGAGEALALGAEDAFILDLQSSRWIPVDLDGAPPARTGPVAVEVPGGLVAVGAEAAAVFEWSTGRWRSIDPPPFPSRWGVTAVSAPSGVLLWGGRDVADIHNDGALLDVASGRWTRSPSEGAPLARMDAVGIADARQVQVLWGSGGAGLLADAFTLR
jgi:hypothetical protein